jgi:hypothetical protein
MVTVIVVDADTGGCYRGVDPCAENLVRLAGQVCATPNASTQGSSAMTSRDMPARSGGAAGAPWWVTIIRTVDGVDLDDPVEAAQGRSVFELRPVDGATP